LVEDMKYKSCSDYCGVRGLGCVGAWEELDDSCAVESAVACDARLRTDDLICECEAPGMLAAMSCDLGVVKETCSADGCKVLAKGMRFRSCSDYCGERGLACADAWEEHDGSCTAEFPVGCEAKIDSDDLLCACSPATGGPPAVAAAAQSMANASSPATSAKMVDSAIASSSGRCFFSHNVEEVCSANGCKVLVEDMKYKSCSDYCGVRGLGCVGAWEELDDSCAVESAVACDARLRTDDLICECEAPGMLAAMSCDLGVVKETCSADGCKVLAKGMRFRSCSDYCGERGLACADAWEEHDGSCTAEFPVGCEAKLDSDDLLCACSPPTGGPPAAAATPKPAAAAVTATLLP